MIETFQYRIQPAIIELHETLVAQMSDCSLADALGSELNHLRGDGTGRSIVLLSVMNDVLRMNEIALGSNPSQHRQVLDAILPFCQSAAKTFAAKGLDHYQPYAELELESIEEFLAFYRSSRLPFTGESPVTQWSGLQICRNVALHTNDVSVVDAYEGLIETVIEFWEENGLSHSNSSEIAALNEFLSDSCEDIRDDLGEVPSPSGKTSHEFRDIDSERSRLVAWQEKLKRHQNEIAAVRANLHNQYAELRNRENQLQEIQKQLATERMQLKEQAARLQADRERLAIDQSALAIQRQKVEEKQELIDNQAGTSISRSIESERAALWKDREELALERDRLAAEKSQLEQDREAFERERFEQSHRESTVAESSTTKNSNGLTSDSSIEEADEIAELDFVSILTSAAQIGDLSTVQSTLDRLPEELCDDLHWGNRESNNAVLAATVGNDAEKFDSIVTLLASTCPDCVRSVFSTLLQILRDVSSPPSARRRSAIAIGCLGSDANHAISALFGVLESEDRSVSLAASEAIAKIDLATVETEAIPYLTTILQQSGSASQSQAWTANLYAARADLYRLSNQPRRALDDYEESLKHRPNASQRDLRFCEEMRDLLKSLTVDTKRTART